LLCASPISAGSLGNGAAQRAASYEYCYGGTPNTVYFSRTFAVTSSVTGQRVPFEHYLAATYGFHGPAAQCITGASRAEAEHDEATRKTWFPGRQIVQVEWAGGVVDPHSGSVAHACSDADRAHGRNGC